jgi:CHASE2 domain-containing sensor protein
VERLGEGRPHRVNISDFKRRIVENRKSGLIGAAIATVVGLLFLTSDLGNGFAHLSYDLPYLFRHEIEITNIVIVYMDDESAFRLGQFKEPIWDRKLHADLLDKLNKYHADAVVFDVWFSDPMTNKPAADEAFAQAVQRTPKIVLGTLASEKEPGELSPPVLFPPVVSFRKKDARGLDNWGLVDIPKDKDGRIRRHYHLPGIFTSLSWRAAETLLEDPPRDPLALRWINFYGPAHFIPHISYLDTTKDDPNLLNVFSNKIVFIGTDIKVGTTLGLKEDKFDTPVTRWSGGQMPGVEIHATCFLNLERGDSLTRLSSKTQFGLFALIGVFFGFTLVMFRPVAASVIGATGILAAFASGLLLFIQAGILFPWLTVAAVQIPLALAWSVIVYSVRLQREKTLLETVVRTSRGTGLPVPAVAQATPSSADVATIVAGRGPQTPGAQSSGTPETEPALVIPDHDLVRCVGRGAYGEVWLARDILGHYKAVKVIYKKTFQNEGPFEREFKGIQRFTPISRNHPGWVQILHVGRPPKQDYFYYIMELGDDENTGQTVNPATYSAKNLARELDRRGKLPVKECLELALSLSSALQYLHSQNLIHRDIKPSNIIFVRDQPKFADIGLVTEVGGTNRDVTYVGTQGYIPPEGPGKPQADVFSLGKVIYETSMGRDREQFPELPTTLVERPDKEDLLQLNEVILKACEYDVERRFQTAQELYDALLKVQFDTRHLRKQ